MACADMARGAAIYMETFEADALPAGWTTRSGTPLTPPVSGGFDNTMDALGNAPVSESRRLTFASANYAQNAGIRTTQSQFVGDLLAVPGGVTGFTFDFWADVRPTVVSLRINGAGGLFTVALLPQLNVENQWVNLATTFDYYSTMGWYGAGTGEDFTNTLHNVSWVEISITRPAGTPGTYNYYVDNFELTNRQLFIPEPASGVLLLGSSFLLLARRRLMGESASQARWRYLRLRLAQRRSI